MFVAEGSVSEAAELWTPPCHRYSVWFECIGDSQCVFDVAGAIVLLKTEGVKLVKMHVLKPLLSP